MQGHCAEIGSIRLGSLLLKCDRQDRVEFNRVRCAALLVMLNIEKGDARDRHRTFGSNLTISPNLRSSVCLTMLILSKN